MFIVLFCASGLAQTSSLAPPASAGTASTEQNPLEAKPEEYTLDPIEISKATYPPAAKERKVQGQVVGMILVAENGSVENVRFFKGEPLLTSAAEEAAKKWKFKPVVKDGKPIPVVARTTFNFVLADDVRDTQDVAAELDQIRNVPQRVRISQGVSTGLLVHEVQPDYPPEAKVCAYSRLSSTESGDQQERFDRKTYAGERASYAGACSHRRREAMALSAVFVDGKSGRG